VRKTTKFERLRATGLVQSQYVSKNLISTWKEATQVHKEIANNVINEMEEKGREVRVQRDYLLKEEDFEGVDLVCSLGGDGTFLKTASMIKSSNLPIVGVNTDPARSVGHLTSIPIPFHERSREVPRFIDFLD